MQKHTAIYSQEWGFDDTIKLYNGGLGVLNGCLALSLADIGYSNVVLIGINYREGLLKQRIENNRQVSEPDGWNPEDQGYERLPNKIRIQLYGNDLVIGAWKKKIPTSIIGESIDHILLDANEPENPEWAIEFTKYLYDDRFKLQQNLILGIAGPQMLEALGYDVGLHHMQEGAAAFVALWLLYQKGWNVDSIRDQLIFTNHTIIGAGMPRFSYSDLYKTIGCLPSYEHISKLAGESSFNTNLFAAKLSGYINGVSRLHAEVMRGMPEFEGKEIDYITNGVHWRFMSEGIQRILDECIQGNWRLNPELLSQAANINPSLLQRAHSADKKTLVDLINERTIKTRHFEEDVFTAVYAKRITSYKNPDQLLRFLVEAQNLPGPVQIVYSGKVHRNDAEGHNILNKILGQGLSQRGHIRFAFLPGYSMEYGKKLTAGADLWVVTAETRSEACGTSQAKNGINGNKTISTDGGCWPEVDGRFGENGYTFETPQQFQEQFAVAMRDFLSGGIDKYRPRVIAEFGPKFSAVRMAKKYITVYSGGSASKQPAELVA